MCHAAKAVSSSRTEASRQANSRQAYHMTSRVSHPNVRGLLSQTCDEMHARHCCTGGSLSACILHA